MFEFPWLLATLLALLAYPLYVLLMAGVLRACGVPRPKVAKWALRQAGRQRLVDLLRAAWRLLSGKEDDE
jgi:hypothetical protein